MVVPNDSVMMVHSGRRRQVPEIGEAWQADVASFLLDLYPSALEQGLGVGDIYAMTLEEGSSDEEDASFLIADAMLEEETGSGDDV